MKKKILFILCLLSFGFYFFPSNEVLVEDIDFESDTVESNIRKVAGKQSKKVERKVLNLNKEKVLEKKEEVYKVEPFIAVGDDERSLKNLSDLLIKSLEMPPEILVRDLTEKGMAPIGTNQGDEDDFIMIRTEKTLPGTRYFHAQYEKNDAGDIKIQHLSFEFKPGEKSLERVILSIQNSFGLKVPPKEKEGFLEWSLEDKKILWIKKMTYEELKESPFNAYGKNDEGTILVTLENEIHGANDNHHH